MRDEAAQHGVNLGFSLQIAGEQNGFDRGDDVVFRAVEEKDRR